MELIDRKEAFNTIPKIIITPPRNGKMLWAKLIDEWHKNMAELPIIESRPKGKWLIDDNYKIELDGEYCGCPHCKEWTINGRGMDKLNYCPNCGADMRGEE